MWKSGTQVKGPEQEEPAGAEKELEQARPDPIPARPILKKNSIPLGERLARLAGYSLKSQPDQGRARRRRVSFNPKVTRLDWRGKIEEDLKEGGANPIRFINRARPLNHPLAASINFLDAQLLPQSLWSGQDLMGCRCAPCNKREEAPCGSGLDRVTCEYCDYHPAMLWD